MRSFEGRGRFLEKLHMEKGKRKFPQQQLQCSSTFSRIMYRNAPRGQQSSERFSITSNQKTGLIHQFPKPIVGASALRDSIYKLETKHSVHGE
jgi:hypothetical protein